MKQIEPVKFWYAENRYSYRGLDKKLVVLAGRMMDSAVECFKNIRILI